MKLKIEQEVFQLPETWEQVSTGDYLQIQKVINDSERDDEDRKIEIIKILSKIPQETLNKCSVKSLKEAYNNLGFLNTEIPVFNLNEIVRIGDQEFYFDHNLDEATHGMMVDLRSNLKSDDHLKILATLFRPVKEKKYQYGKWKGIKKANYISQINIEDYDSSQIPDRAELFKQLPIHITNTAASFFLIFSIQLFNSTRDYLSQELQAIEQLTGH